jgi:DNA-binding transcriptional ArsR family regulator
MEELGKLFGNPARVKIIRLFLFNDEEAYDNEEISKRTKASKATVRKETLVLEKADLIKKRSFFKEVKRGRGKKAKMVKKRVRGWALNPDFYYLSALKNLLIKTPPFSNREIEKRFKKAGKVKLLLVSGVFIQEWDNKVDILVVGDKLNHSIVDHAVRVLESEVGTELSYTVFNTPEFEYRMNIYDKLIRNILDYPHSIVINKLGL